MLSGGDFNARPIHGSGAAADAIAGSEPFDLSDHATGPVGPFATDPAERSYDNGQSATPSDTARAYLRVRLAGVVYEYYERTDSSGGGGGGCDHNAHHHRH